MRSLSLALLACLLASPGQAATHKAKSDSSKSTSPNTAATAATPAPASNSASAKLSDFELGKSVLGSGSLGDAKGKGAVIEAWGVNCPPCIASLPHMQELSVKYKDKVLFFGAEAQMSDKKAIEAVIHKAGVTYPIFSGLDKCPIQFNAIPHAFVFDSAGKLIFSGNPYEPGFGAAVEKAASGAKGGSAASSSTAATSPKA